MDHLKFVAFSCGFQIVQVTLCLLASSINLALQVFGFSRKEGSLLFVEAK